MSQISDEIIDLIIEKRLESLRELKNQMTEPDYKQSKYNIVTSRDNNSLSLETMLNQIKDRDLLSSVILNLKKNIETGITYIDSTGKLNITEISKSINTIQTNYKKMTLNENIKEIATTVLSFTIINNMLNRFDTLTLNEKNQLRENYQFLNAEQRKKYKDGMHARIRNSKADNKTKAEWLKEFECDFNKSIDLILDVLQKKYETTKIDFSKISNGELTQILDQLHISEEIKSQFLKVGFEKLIKISNVGQEVVDTDIELYEARQAQDTKKTNNLEKKLFDLKSTQDYKSYLFYRNLLIEKDEKSVNNPSISDIYTSLQNDSQKNIPNISSNESQISLEQEIAREIKQLTGALAKVGYTQEEIQEAFTQYKTYFEQIGNDDRQYLSELSTSTLKETLSNEFEELDVNENAKSILKIISNITYKDKLQMILADQSKVTYLLQQFDQALTSDITFSNLPEEDLKAYFDENAIEINFNPPNIQGKIDDKEDSKIEHPKDPMEPTIDEPENSQGLAMIQQDNSFIGKIKRVIATIKDKKEKNHTQGFFSRLKESVQDVFGNKNSGHSETQASSNTKSPPDALEKYRVPEVTGKIEKNHTQTNKEAKENNNPTKEDDSLLTL